jgi:predicted nucleic acid-binding protein
MNIVLDTPIVLAYLTGEQRLLRDIPGELDPFIDGNRPVVSVLSKAELLSLGLRQTWSEVEQRALSDLLNRFVVMPISDPVLLVRFSELDAYARGRHPDTPLPQGIRARKLSRNDLWVGALASTLGAPLLTNSTVFMRFAEAGLVNPVLLGEKA